MRLLKSSDADPIKSCQNGIYVGMEELSTIASRHFGRNPSMSSLKVELLTPHRVDELAKNISAVRNELALAEKRYIRERTPDMLSEALDSNDQAVLLIVDQIKDAIVAGAMLNLPSTHNKDSFTNNALKRLMFNGHNLDKVAYLQGAFVNPEHRGHHLHRLLIQLRESVSTANNRRYSFARVASFNEKSLSGLEKLGYRPITHFPLSLVYTMLFKNLALCCLPQVQP